MRKFSHGTTVFFIVIKAGMSHRINHGNRQEVKRVCQMEQLFPVSVRTKLMAENWQEGVEEIRVRVGQPMEFLYANGNRYLLKLNETDCFGDIHTVLNEPERLYAAKEKDIAEMLSYISNYSLYAYREEMKHGYITVEGGHRIGIAGQTALENGRVSGMHHISFLNIRVAHERIGCAREILPYLLYRDSIYNTLFLSAPGAGKTTYLRDSIRMISRGNGLCPGLKVCVVDERSEIAACHMGVPQNDVGPRTDVLDGCGKAEGMMMLLRSMSPQVLAVDELGTEKDFFAVEQAVYSGSRVLGTIHAGEIRELMEKPFLRKWMERRIFKRFVFIMRAEDGKRKIQIYDENMEKLC